MALLLLILFIAVPVMELYLLIEIGGWISSGVTIALVVLTAILGSWQLRMQGIKVLGRARAELDAGRAPAKELFDGLCLLVAGLCLLIPGFVTDSLGALLFLPFLRNALRLALGRHLLAKGRVEVHGFGSQAHYRPGSARPGSGHPGSGHPGSGRPTVEGEFRDVTERADEEQSSDSAKALPNEPKGAEKKTPWSDKNKE